MSGGFWEWSLRIYARPGVEALLLTLQDRHGLDVNLLLWRLWCAERFEEPSDLVGRKAADAMRRWSDDVTAPMRRVRRALKAGPQQALAGRAAAVAERLKQIELAAEKIAQDVLEGLATEHLLPAQDAEGAVSRARRSLAAYVRTTGAPKSEGFSVSLLEDLIELTILRSESDRDVRG